MAKAAEAFRTISEVAEELELQKHVLRFWEVKFPQIKPMKRGGGRRYYRPADMELLRGIRHLLHAEGYTIKGVQKILRERGVDVVKRVGSDIEGKSSGVRASAPASPDRDRDAAAQPPAERASSAASASERRPKGEAHRSTHKPSAVPPRNGTSRARDIAKAIAELEACRAILLGKSHQSESAEAGKAKRTMRAAG